ncbi:MAG: MFS family permease [Paracrocinitomix sp.]
MHVWLFRARLCNIASYGLDPRKPCPVTRHGYGRLMRSEDLGAAGIDSPRAWLVVVGVFFSSFVTLGITYSFGAFFQDMAAEFNSDSAATSAIFAITTFAFFWLSLITGRLADRWGPKRVLLVGAASLLLGLLATSYVQSLALGYVTYGVGVGIAASTGYIPMVAVVGGWFDRYRATAVGLAVAGVGAGTLVISPLSAALVDAYGWRQTYRLLAVVGSACLVLCTLLVERPPTSTGAGQPARFAEAWESKVFRRLQLSALCSGLALFVPFVFVGQYAKERGVGSVASAVLVGVLGGASVLARVGFGSAVRRFGSVRLYRASFALIASSFVVWFLAGSSYGLLVAFALVLGVGYGGFVALSTIVLTERLGVVGLGSIMGLFYTSQGLGGLIGPPAAGWLIDTTGSYRPTLAICCGLVLLALLILRPLPVAADGSLEPEPQRPVG